MQTRPSICIRILWLVFAIVSTSLFLAATAYAQRIIPASTSTSQTVSASPAEAKSKFVPNPNSPKYKLIFPTNYDVRFYVVGKKERVHPTETKASGLKKFIEQLNDAGAEGYRLVSAIGDSTAIVKLGTVQYEYAGFDLITTFYTGAPGFPEKYAPLAKQGYHLASQSLIRFDCLSTSDDDQHCDHYEFYIFEREKGVEKPIVFKNVFPHPDGKPDITMKAAFNERLAAGFYPTTVMTNYDVLFEQNTEIGERFADRTDVQVVMASPSYWGRDDLPKKIELLTKEGYRLALINYQLAVMYRPRLTAPPVSYVWLKLGKRNWVEKRKERDFQKELRKLQENGAIYRMTYTNIRGDVNTLIFEESAVAGGKRSEYRVLKFELQAIENLAARKMQVGLTSSSKEAWAEFNRLVNDGFEVRDLFVTDEACVLLERNSAQ